MSAFDNWEKDEIFENITNFIVNKKEQNPELKTTEILKEVFEIVTVAFNSALYDIESKYPNL